MNTPNSQLFTANLEDILINMREDYRAFLNYYMNFSPIFAQGKIRQYSWSKALAYSILLRIAVLLLRMFCLNAPPKYVFQGLRHINLIKVLLPSDVMIIGGRGEFIYCRKMGYRFHWGGYLSKSFELFFFADKIGAISDAVSFVRKLFTPSVNIQRYLFLWEDSQPIGLTLSLALRSVESINVVCVSHGYNYAFSEKRIILDGSNCKFNFVYDVEQAKLFNKSTTFVLGLPYEVKLANTIKPKVVLVEHTGLAAGAEYIVSVYHFLKLYGILKRAGYDVIYRVRPGGDTIYASSMFSDISVADKFDLLAESRMIFIGFSSTLLYEAKVFGNLVIGLDTSELFDQRNFDVDATISADEYNELPSRLPRLMNEKLVENPICNVESLSSRFFSCIKSIDSYNMNHG